MAPWFLVIFLYAGPFAEGDSMTVTTVPMTSAQACSTAANSLKPLVSSTKKEVRSVCLDTGAK